MNKILIQLLILSVLFAALTEDAEALGFFGKKKAGLALKGALLAKKAKIAKLALPKLKKVAKVGALKKIAKVGALKKIAKLGALKKKGALIGHKKVVAVPIARPNSHELSHYVESAHPIAWSGHHGQPATWGWQSWQPSHHGTVIGHGAVWKKPIIAPVGIKKAGIKKLALKKAGLKKLGLLKKMLG